MGVGARIGFSLGYSLSNLLKSCRSTIIHRGLIGGRRAAVGTTCKLLANFTIGKEQFFEFCTTANKNMVSKNSVKNSVSRKTITYAEKLAAFVRSMPNNTAVDMVAPEREMPGRMAMV